MSAIDAAKRGLPGSLQPILISKKDTAVVLSVSVRTVQNLIARKQLPTRRIGRRCMVPYRAVVEFARRDHPSAGE
jgi:excisionase family DNA binding protein